MSSSKSYVGWSTVCINDECVDDYLKPAPDSTIIKVTSSPMKDMDMQINQHVPASNQVQKTYNSDAIIHPVHIPTVSSELSPQTQIHIDLPLSLPSPPSKCDSDVIVCRNYLRERLINAEKELEAATQVVNVTHRAFQEAQNAWQNATLQRNQIVQEIARWKQGLSQFIDNYIS